MPSNTTDDTTAHQLVLVTGPSGAGRSSAIRALEDIGFEAIDNLPLTLLPRLLSGPAPDKPMALGIDIRNRDFSTAALMDVIDRMGEGIPAPMQVLYLDCDAGVLLRRFSETRRPHPLAPAEDPGTGIAREIDLLVPIKERADILLDTSEMTPHQLRAELGRWFAPQSAQGLVVSVHSFSYKRGLPRGLDMVLDCRFLRNPYWQAELRELDGRDGRVADYIRADARFAPFQERVMDLVELLLPAYEAEGKAYFSIGFGCTGGQHRSVAMAQTMGKALAEGGWQVSIRHREIVRGAKADGGLTAEVQSSERGMD
jgi:UPF0042 nucleotide-binding protein